LLGYQQKAIGADVFLLSDYYKGCAAPVRFALGRALLSFKVEPFPLELALNCH
jgi:hypothetical protein